VELKQAAAVAHVLMITVATVINVAAVNVALNVQKIVHVASAK